MKFKSNEAKTWLEDENGKHFRSGGLPPEIKKVILLHHVL